MRVYEHSAVHDVADDLHRAHGQGRVARARRVLLATSAYPPLVRAIQRYIVPVYDYALDDRAASTWREDRLARTARASATAATSSTTTGPTADGRILFGGWDAVYRYGGPVGPRHDEHDADVREARPALLPHVPAARGRALHPPLGRRDRHLAAASRVFFGTRHGGRLAYATGYTGLGVAAARFGGRTALDLLDGRDTEATRTALRAHQAGPVPARAAALRRRPVHAQPARGGRPQPGPPRPLAASRSTASGSASTPK